MYLTRQMTRLQEERYERDCTIYREYSEIMKAHEGFVSMWKVAGMLAPKYGVGQAAVRSIILRMEEYGKGERVRVDQMNKNNLNQ